MTVRTANDQRVLNYEGVPHTRFPEFLRDEDLLSLYQQSDLLVMPMLDCTANNAVLEAMACGTPVMINRVGGVSEYVNPDHCVVMDEKNVREWVDTLVELSRRPETLENMRPSCRSWAERFDWRKIAPLYRDLYRDVVAGV